jgi:hypothetical protein
MEGQQMKQKQHDMRGNEINNPYNVLASRVMRNLQELKGNLGSLEDPEKLLEAYVLQRNLATLVGTLLEIYEPSLEKVDLPVDLDQIEKANEGYRSKLVEKLSQNQGITPPVLGAFSKEDYEKSRRFLAECYDFTKKKRKRT